jgi:regulator of sirC expression with transglutaminase-like and TPR domain
MPFLFIILGQRLGIDVTASTAPNHLLVKFRNESGVWINLEATSGANPARESWMRQQSPSITDEAIANGVYLRPLGKKETVAVMATVLAEHYLHLRQYRRAIATADLILEYYPKDVGMMTLKAVAYGRLARTQFVQKYPSPEQIPASQRGYFNYLSRNYRLWFAKAEALGWREETREEKDEYFRLIKKARQSEMDN